MGPHDANGPRDVEIKNHLLMSRGTSQNECCFQALSVESWVTWPVATKCNGECIWSRSTAINHLSVYYTQLHTSFNSYFPHQTRFETVDPLSVEVNGAKFLYSQMPQKGNHSLDFFLSLPNNSRKKGRHSNISRWRCLRLTPIKNSLTSDKLQMDGKPVAVCLHQSTRTCTVCIENLKT